ncbi:MAG: M24 family metallopeptidase [Candidatus Hodarchaeales archaeon]
MAIARRYVTQKKLALLCEKLNKAGIDLAVFQDFEYRRDENVRYLSGHPMDALLVLNAETRETFLIPWDVLLARRMAEVTEIIDVKDHQRSFNAALQHVIKEMIGKTSDFAIGTIDRYPAFGVERLKGLGNNIKVDSSPLNLYEMTREIRAIKTEKEIELLRKSCQLSSEIIPLIEENIRNNNLTEIDLAVFVEGEMRKRGGEKVAFETLVANPEHSNELHCFPAAGRKKLKFKDGFGLIDFGMVYDAMCSDITTPFIFGKLTEEQKKMLQAVIETHDMAIDYLKENTGVLGSELNELANKNLDKYGFKMPHSLGHGLGLATHDPPVVRSKPENPEDLKYFKDVTLEPGMILTIEPGVYLPEKGGCRLEDDIHITRNGVEVLTESRPLYFEL